MPTKESLVGHAACYVFGFGLSIVPMNGKRPIVKWAHLQERRPRLQEILNWDGYDGLAMVTGQISNIVVIDCDTDQNAEWWVNNRPPSSVIVKTKRGKHFYYRWPGAPIRNDANVKVYKIPRYDVRGDGGYVLLPPSPNYTWVHPLVKSGQIELFDPKWRPDNFAGHEKKITSGEKYISAIYAIEGQAGSNQTFRAVASLKDAGFSEGEAVFAMQNWNLTNAKPPWSDRELLHKIKSVYK